MFAEFERESFAKSQPYRTDLERMLVEWWAITTTTTAGYGVTPMSDRIRHSGPVYRSNSGNQTNFA